MPARLFNLLQMPMLVEHCAVAPTISFLNNVVCCSSFLFTITCRLKQQEATFVVVVNISSLAGHGHLTYLANKTIRVTRLVSC